MYLEQRARRRRKILRFRHFQRIKRATLQLSEEGFLDFTRSGCLAGCLAFGQILRVRAKQPGCL